MTKEAPAPEPPKPEPKVERPRFVLFGPGTTAKEIMEQLGLGNKKNELSCVGDAAAGE